MRKFILLVLTIILATAVNAQEVIQFPHGFFLQDSTKIGEHVQYSLQIEYSPDHKVLFPDSLFNFFPFEYVKKDFFPTLKMANGNLRDSVIYTFATYELDSVYYLRTPVFVFKGSDSISYYSNADSLIFHPIVLEMPQNPELKTDTQFQEVPSDFNYIYFIIGMAIIVILLTVLVLLFGKKAYRMFVIYRLKKSFQKYKAELNHILANAGKNELNVKSQKALNIWKGYLEKLDRKPITKLTTKEITHLYPDKSLHQRLKDLDRSLYGGVQIENINEIFSDLEKFSLERLTIKIDELNNG